MKKAVFCVVLCVMLLVSNLAVTAVSAEELYSDMWYYPEVGTTSYEADTAYTYTLFVIAPTEVGKYVISCEDHLLGIVSYTDMWLQQEPGTHNVNATSAEWKCTSVGQGIIVAVETGDGAITISVEQASLEQPQEIPWAVYENKTAPQAFTLAGASKTLTRVNTLDATVDTAVLGEDGYYHLNAANGPILFANVKDSQLSLAAMIDYGQIRAVSYDSNNTPVSKVDYNEAVSVYVAASDANTGLYPLTDDLIEVFVKVGESKGWYGGGYLGGSQEDAWMFACYYTAYGDVDFNCTVNVSDLTKVFQYVNGIGSLHKGEALIADMNGDGTINLMDAARLFYMANGLL